MLKKKSCALFFLHIIQNSTTTWQYSEGRNDCVGWYKNKEMNDERGCGVGHE